MALLARHRIVLPCVWLISAGYLFTGYDRGWIGHDAGTLGHTAERALAGELPHRDFADPYTGGLSYLHAAGFALWGVKLHTLRVMLVAWTLAFVPAVYAIASRAAPAWACGLATLLCLVWSVPNYPEAMPSWFNLFFAAFGTLAFLKHIESGRLRWVFLAGTCGGASFLVKSVGLYYVAAGLLFLIFREQTLSRAEGEAGPARGYGVVVVLGLAAFLAALGRLVGSLHGSLAMPVLHFALPGFACAAVLIRGEWSLRRLAGTPRWRRLLRLGAPFLGGALLPVVLFLVPYALTGSLDDWARGVFVEPLQRLNESIYPLPPLGTVWTAAPFAAILAIPAFRAWRARRRGSGSPSMGLETGSAMRDLEVAGLLLAVLGGAALVAFGSSASIYPNVWNSMRHSAPLVLLAGCGLLWPRAGGTTTAVGPEREQKLFLLTAMASLVALVQIPQAWGIYFCYAAPLAVLAALFVATTQPLAPRRLYACLGTFYLAFAVAWMNRNEVRELPDRFRPLERYARLDVERGGIRVPAHEAALYAELVHVVQAHSAPAGFIYATPDSPHVYFLTARQNPTRTLFDLFDADWDDPAKRATRIATQLDERGVDLAVLSARGEVSRVVHSPLVTLLRSRYPNAEAVPGAGADRPAPGAPPVRPSFEVRWRNHQP